jgi:hypothetical protein
MAADYGVARRGVVRRRPGSGHHTGYRGGVGTDDGRGGRRTGLLVALLGAGLLALLVGVGEQRVAIGEPHGDAGSSVLEFGVASCNVDPRVEVEESTTTVTVTAYVERPGILDGRDDCRDAARVALSSPLGTRVVVDGSSGEVLAVSPAE